MDFATLIEGIAAFARSTEEPETLLAAAAASTARTLRNPRVSILLNCNATWKLGAEYSVSDVAATSREVLRRLEAEVARDLARETAVLELEIADLKAPVEFAKALEGLSGSLRVRRLLFAPIVEDAQTIGIVFLYRTSHHRVAQRERRALQALAATIGLALQNLQAVERARTAAEREDRTHQLLAAIRNAGSVDGILKSAVDGLGKALGVSRVVIFKSECDLERSGGIGYGKPLPARSEFRQSALVPSLMGDGMDLNDAALASQLAAGDIIAVSDTSDSDGIVRAMGTRLGVRALVLAPVSDKGRPIAVLALEQFDHPRHFSAEELRLIRLVTEQIASAMDKAVLYREAQENARREALIRRINSAIHCSLDADDVLQTIVNELGAALGVCRCRLALMPSPLPEVFPITHEYVAKCCEGRQPGMRRVHTPKNAILQSLLAADTPITINDPANDRRLGPARDRYRVAEVKSLLLASIRYGGRPIGIFSFYHCESAHQWTQGELDIAQSVAQQAAVAIRQSELYREVRESAMRAALVNQIITSIRRSLDLRQTLAVAVEEVGRAFGVNRTNFRQLVGDKIVCVAEYLTDPVLTIASIDADADDYVMRELLRTRRPLVVDDLPAFASTNPHLAAGVRTWQVEYPPLSQIVCPIFVNREFWGALTITQTDRLRKWSSSEIELMEEVCAQIEVAVSHSRLFEETRQAAERAALISHIVHGINQSNQLDQIFPIVAKELGEQMGVDRIAITRRQEDGAGWMTECAYSEGKMTYGNATFADRDVSGFSGLLDGDVIRCDDVEHDPRLTPLTRELLAQAGTHSFASVEVVFNGEAQLVISAIMRNSTRHWSEEEIELLRAAGNQVRVALQRAELFTMVSKGKYEWEATFDALTDGVFIFDELGILRRVNQTGAAFENSTVRELVGRQCCSILPGIEGEVCRVSHVIETNRPITFEMEPEMLQRPVLVTIAPLGAASNPFALESNVGPRGAVCIVRDLSELRAAEAVAREQRNFLIKLIEQANDSIFALSADGHFIWFNEHLIKQSGYSRDTLRSVTYLDCVPESERPQAAERFRRALAGSAQSFEIRTFRRNSESRLMLMTFTPIYDAGRVTSVLSIARDVTEERLASERAAQADKLRALGQLASGVAHNFNNILAAILGHAQLMKRESSDERLTSRLDIIEKAALDGAQTVKRIQSFGLQQSDEAYQTFDVNQLLQDSTTLTRARWQHEAQARGLTYDVSLDLRDVPLVRGAASELREVFVNMILNALDAMPQGGRLRIGSKIRNEKVLVSFSDNGLGMTREVRQRIFEPFFTTKGVTGMGLGLAVSYGIVERHGGEIELRSVPGRGTTFTVSLPPSRVPAAIDRAIDGAIVRTARVLVVDDDDRVRDVIVGMLKLAGHRADQAPSGREALVRLEHEAFDLVFTDLSMPDVDGWALAEEIRRRWPELKIVMVTGYAAQSQRDNERRSLVNEIISKPIRLDDINTTLNLVLA